MKCIRCKNSNPFLFEKIYCETCEKCYYCIKCAHISIFKLCDTLKDDLDFTKEKIDYKLKYQLTSKQLFISDKLKELITTNNVFINAVCGAGKTEIIFETVKDFVNNDKKICFVSPRIEVTSEIYRRFNSVFKTKFGILTSQLKITSGPMFFLTCNQLINYQNLFDLVIVDEVDAFPLYGDKVLENAIINALNNDGKLIYMSATPIKIDASFIELTLDERYHQQKIPIPVYQKQAITILSELISSSNWIVFFPTIKKLNEIYLELDRKDIIVCHSKIDNVTNKITSLDSNFVIFSTAILERGITLANVNVVVYECDHNNFTLNTLIQIAGRVGRVVPYTTGEIIFMGNSQTIAVNRAIKYLGKYHD